MKKLFIAMLMLASLPYLNSQPLTLSTTQPPFLKAGDRVALLSPSYASSLGEVDSTANVLRDWGLVPVIGPNVGKVFAGKYAGTIAERVADLRWALNDTTIKAIICNRGGYGTIHYINAISLEEWGAHPKWLVGFSDITTLHGLLTRAGVMSIHGTMGLFLAKGGTDSSSTLMRDLLLGTVPRYEVAPHPQNIEGHATGVLVGGNLCTFAPNLGTQADALQGEDFILFIEEVEESMHNVDRQFYMLALNGVFSANGRCKGVVLGDFTDCGNEFTFESIEAMLRQYLLPLGIPLLCGFPAGHDAVNLPLVMGAPVTLDVRNDGATLQFGIDGRQQEVKVE